MDGGSGNALASSGIPLAPGMLMPADVGKVRVLVGGVEQSIYAEALSGRHKDGSVRSVLVQLAYTVGSSPVAAELAIGSARTTPDRSKAPITNGLPAGAVLPTDPTYLASTQIVGPTIPLSESPTSADFFRRYEDDFRGYGDQRWPTEGGNWGYTYYDRALIWYAWWVRTGNPEYWRRGTIDALAYRRDYLEANNYGTSPHWSQVEGLDVHYLAIGDEQSRYAIGRMNQALGGNLPHLSDIASTEGRIQARVILALLAGWRVNAPINDGTWEGYLQEAIERTLSTQQSDGSYRFKVWCDQQSNYMTGLVNDALIKTYEQFRPDSRIPAAVQRSIDFTWTTQWLGDQGAFKYMSGPCPNVGNEEPSVDLNMLIGTAYGWYYQISGDTIYRTRGDEIFQSAVAGTWLAGYKQFNQQYYSSFRYLAYRR